MFQASCPKCGGDFKWIGEKKVPENGVLCPVCVGDMKGVLNFEEVDGKGTLIIHNGKFSYWYFLNDKPYNPLELIEELANKLELKIVYTGDGTKDP